MSNHRPRLSRRDAERLLDDPSAANSVLGTALTAARAPARPGELRREEATVASFHSARLTPSPTARSNFVSPSKLGSRAAARAVIATGAVVALASGGFALASSALLPGLPDQASDQATESVAKASTPSETTGPSETTESEDASGSTRSSESAETESPRTSAAPTPSFKGLCKAFQATDRSAHGKSLDSAAFTALATEAGGADQVATYCVALIGEPTSKPTPGKPTDKPTPAGKPTDKPTPGKPTSKPTPAGKPTDKPSPDKPSPDKPSPGKPTDKPAPAGKGGGKDSTTSGS